MKGDSVTLYTNVTTTQQDEILWYFNDTRIAMIAGDLSRICTDVQCNEDTERFRDRLNLENQTGSLTIKNIQTADTGVYQLKIFSRSSIREKTFSVTVDVPDKVKTISVKEGESVTFDPGVIKTANYVMRWYFNDSLITEITGDQSKICTDDECKERFRDRLKLNNQTGSLTITDIRTTDSGDYKVLIISHILQNSVSITSLKTFIFTVIDSGLSSAAVAGICVGVAVVLLFVAAAAAGVIYYHKRLQAGQNNGSYLKDSSPNLSDPMLMDNANETSPDEDETEAAKCPQQLAGSIDCGIFMLMVAVHEMEQVQVSSVPRAYTT
ncbi:hypothetical protein cypCar_00045274 [Cyprinus carpio]|nr:hypothetical protein cypCar_00045274 [Cyprinus carpio]